MQKGTYKYKSNGSTSLAGQTFLRRSQYGMSTYTESDNDLHQKVLACETRDRYAVAICKRDEIVGHVPKYISTLYSLFTVGLSIAKFWENGDIQGTFHKAVLPLF